MANNDTAKKGDKQKELPPKDERENGRKLDVLALENWLWEAACTIRGPIDAPKYKDYILPLIFLKRLSDVFEDETGIWPMSLAMRRRRQNGSIRTTSSFGSISPRRHVGRRLPRRRPGWVSI